MSNPNILSQSQLDARYVQPTQVGSWSPTDNALKAANMVPEMASSGVALTASTSYVMKLHTAQSMTVSNFVFYVATGGSTLTGWYAALYDESGTLIASSATSDQSVRFTNVGTAVLPFTSSVSLATGTYYVALQTGTANTAPQIQRAASNVGNVGLTSGLASSATAPRFSVAANAWSGATPPSTLGTLTTSLYSIFVALS